MIVEVEERTAEVLSTLRAQADARKMSLDEHLRLFAEAGDVSATNSHLSGEEFDQLLDQISEGLPSLHSLPADFSRKDIYAEHD